MKLVLNGPDKYPGAKILEKKMVKIFHFVTLIEIQLLLENGDIVHQTYDEW